MKGDGRFNAQKTGKKKSVEKKEKFSRIKN